ncbi:hypothetical protein I862_04460 [endosymbiont of Acanthamoeba sp. UWC8]|uniref:hypothetical protein n=1 Tax=endosymbiont of Acanthamoeba sp. UWC8 TaxID=86106 RepID=UPI0004D1704B|nr:hypothetical protein [endosymbiont of Acanthamoeba sp. UWC8]AIF81452.1 hypothetical protein I862_04460 [endosymbiont of Acanthamoeba sp. UWC8]
MKGGIEELQELKTIEITLAKSKITAEDIYKAYNSALDNFDKLSLDKQDETRVIPVEFKYDNKSLKAYITAVPGQSFSDNFKHAAHLKKFQVGYDVRTDANIDKMIRIFTVDEMLVNGEQSGIGVEKDLADKTFISFKEFTNTVEKAQIIRSINNLEGKSSDQPQEINEISIAIQGNELTVEDLKLALELAYTQVDKLGAPVSEIKLNFKDQNGNSFETDLVTKNGASINKSFMDNNLQQIRNMTAADIQKQYAFNIVQNIGKRNDLNGIKISEDIIENFSKVESIKTQRNSVAMSGRPQAKLNTEKIQVEVSGDKTNNVAQQEDIEIASDTGGLFYGAKKEQIEEAKVDNSQKIDDINNVILAPITGSIQMSNIRAALKVASIDARHNELNNKVNINFYDPVQKKGFLVELESINDKSITDFLNEVKLNQIPLENVNLQENIRFKVSAELPGDIKIEENIMSLFPGVKQQQAEVTEVNVSSNAVSEVSRSAGFASNTPISVGVAKADVPEMAPVATGVEVGKTDVIRQESAESQAINTKNPQAQEIRNITNSIAQQQGSYAINVSIADDWIQIENVNTAIREALELIKNEKSDISAKFNINFNTVDTKKTFTAKLEFTDQKMLQEIIDNTDYLYKLAQNWRSEAPEPLPKNLVQNLSFRTSHLLPEGISIAKDVLNLFPDIKQQQEQIISTKPQEKPEVSETNPSLFNRIKSYVSEHPIKAAAIGVAATVVGVGALAATVATGGLFAVGAGLAGAAIGAGAYGIVKYNQYKEDENIKTSKLSGFKASEDMLKGDGISTPENSQDQIGKKSPKLFTDIVKPKASADHHKPEKVENHTDLAKHKSGSSISMGG